MNRTARALVSLYALLCLLAGVCVPALHAADTGATGWTAAGECRQDRRDDTPAPPHDHRHCALWHAGPVAPALPEQPGLQLPLRPIANLPEPRTSPVRAAEPHVSLPPPRAPPRA